MKSLFKIALATLVGACDLALALPMHPGSICKSDDPRLVASPRGIHHDSQSRGSAALYCPIIRTAPAPASGFKVWINGYYERPLSIGSGMTCVLESYDYRGNYLGSSYGFIFDPGNPFVPSTPFTMGITLPASQVPTYSNQTVRCALTPGSWIYDVQPDHSNLDIN